MAGKVKKNVVPGFATLVEECEFMCWGDVPEWTPRYPVVKAAKLFGKKSDYFAKLPEGMLRDDLHKSFFVVFETSDGKYAKNQSIPFYETKSILALDVQYESLYRSRYGEILPVSLAAEVVRKDLQTAVKTWNRKVESRNVVDGGMKLLEICSLAKPEELPVDENVLNAFCCGDMEAVEAMDAGLRSLLSYTRHSPNFPETLLGAVCDVGTILRGLAKDEADNERLKMLGAFVNSVKGENAPFSFGQLGRLAETGLDISLLKASFVIYLHWKYKAEQKGGEIDFRNLMADVVELRQTSLKEADWSGAVWLLGSMAGFKSFSAQYHAFKREQKDKVTIVTPEPAAVAVAPVEAAPEAH